MKKLFLLMLTALMSACTADHEPAEKLRTSDAHTSGCKLTLSLTDTRPEFYEAEAVKNAYLTLTLGADATVQAQLQDLMACCGIDQLKVMASLQGSELQVIIYTDNEFLADCICRYDFDFKMSPLTAGDYHLKVYYTEAIPQLQQFVTLNEGDISLKTNQPVRLTVNSPYQILPTDAHGEQAP